MSAATTALNSVLAAQVTANSLKKGSDITKKSADAVFDVASKAFKKEDIIYQKKLAAAIAVVDKEFGAAHKKAKDENDRASTVKKTSDAVSLATNAELTKLNEKVKAT